MFLGYSCNGCHGGGGGGGMCPPLTNDVWVYDGDDDTLFRLVTLGSDELQKQGYTRKGRENVVGPMPPFGTLIKNERRFVEASSRSCARSTARTRISTTSSARRPS